MKWLACLAIAGCTATIDPGVALRVQPASLELDVTLGEPVQSVALRALIGDSDVTSTATLSLDDPTLGALAGASFTPDGHVGGTATIAVSAGGDTVAVPVTVRVHGVRFAAGLPASAQTALAPGNDLIASYPLEPGEGAVLPPGLGTLEVDFGADATDDVHEVSLVSPFADVHVFAPGAPGPRHVALTPDEWQAIARTNRGGAATLEVRSAAATGGPVHVLSAHVEIADVDPSAFVFGGAEVDATGTISGRPRLYRYDPRAAGAALFVAEPPGGSGCIGCHVSVSPDGRHIVAAGMTGAGGGIVGMIIDPATQAVTTVADSPWNTGVYDPGGRLLTSYTGTGELTLRDGATAAPLATLALGEPAAAPAISPDGHSLVYAEMTAPAVGNPAGTALRVRPWDAATATVGPAITVASAQGVLAPQFSSDGAWILYARSIEDDERGLIGVDVVRADGSAAPIELTTNEGDRLPRWMSPIEPARAGGRAPEPFAWIAFPSSRAVGAQAMPGQVLSLWLAAFYPARGVISRPVHLPGQSLGLTALHAPYALP